MSDDLERELAAGERWPGLSLDDGLGPAVRRDAASLSALVDGALSSVAVAKPWWRRKGTAPLVGAGVIALSTAAAAAAGLGPRWVAALSGPEPEQIVQVTPMPADAKGSGYGAARAEGGSESERAQVGADPLQARLDGAPQAVVAGEAAVAGASRPAPDVPNADGPTAVALQSEQARGGSAAAVRGNEAALPRAVNAEPGLQPAAATSSSDGAQRALSVVNPASANIAPAVSAVPAVKGPPSANVAAEPRSLPAVDVRATPEDLLGRASALRKAHSYKAALAVYELILTRYPGSRQSAIARVAAAQIELSQFGDARTAQRRFQEAQGDSELGPEALFGLAEACRAQGDVAGERKALNRLLKEHPESPLATAARKRLASGSAP